ncbi:MAG: ferritin family protein [Desulfatiglandaceae bacterium]
MVFESFEEIMDYAISKEKEAAAFYEEASKQEHYSGAQEIFAGFAKEERKHQDMLKHFSKENVEHYKIQKIPDLKRSDYLVDLTYEPGMAYADILRLAMKREEKAFKFYKDFSERTETDTHQKLFQVLSQEEAKHKLKLETMLDDYLAEMGD